MAQRIFRCQGSRQELEWLRNQGNGWCGDHTELVQEIKIPLSKPLDRVLACHAQYGWSYGEVNFSMRTRQDSCFFRDGSRHFSKEFWGHLIILHQIDPFIVAQPQAQNIQTFQRLSLKTDKLASLGPFFVERSAIPCEEIVVNFLFWQECSKGLLCCLCRELGWTSEWVCPDVPLVAISRTGFFVTEEWLQMANTLDVRIIMAISTPKAWWLSIHLACWSARAPSHGLISHPCGVRLGVFYCWGNRKLFAICLIWIDSWQIDIWGHRIVSYALPDFQSLSLRELAQPPTFFCQFPLYRRTFILVLWNKRQTEASMPRCNVAHLVNGNGEPGALHLLFC